LIVRDVGDRAQIRYEAYNADNALTDATVSVVVTSPSGATSTPSVTHTSTGTYDASFDITAAGKWRWVWTASGAVVDVADSELDAQNPAPLTYASLAELKHALRIPDSDTSDDGELLDRLASATERVNSDCGRPHGFGLDTTTSSRIYRPHHEELLSVDDIGSTTGLIVEIGRDNTWSGIDGSLWDTLPENAIVNGRAIETIRRLVGAWPMWGLQRIRVTAQWGWPSVPVNIKNATILLAARLFRRKDSPEGIRGFSDLGVIRVSRYDSDYDNLLNRYIKDAP